MTRLKGLCSGPQHSVWRRPEHTLHISGVASHAFAMVVEVVWRVRADGVGKRHGSLAWREGCCALMAHIQ